MRGRSGSSSLRTVHAVERELSIVVPAKDEAERLPVTLAALWASSLPRRFSLEVIVVDDGSRDGTAAAARHEGLDVRCVPTSGGAGVAQAVRTGVALARGERVLVCDADGAVPFDDLLPLWEALDHGFDLAIGSRRLGTIEVAQPATRVVVGKAWGRLARLLVPTGVLDTQCGFKLFGRLAAQALFPRSRCTSFAFYVELLALARAEGLGVAEVPVRWRDVPGSKIRLSRDPFAMASDLLSVAWRLRAAGRRSAAGRFLVASGGSAPSIAP